MTESTTAPPTSAPNDEPLNDRYVLRKELGRGGQGITYLADDLETGNEVVVKELLLPRAINWKSIELFQREGTSLKSLSHDGIPSYIDAFHNEAEDRFFLIQEFVDGANFDQLLADSIQCSEDDARAFLSEMLEILEYIHDQKPPVIHRDIKPSNIIRRRSDGRLVLIDFGAAQASHIDDDGGSTVIGTTGYMPVEQLSGRAVPATDLYALGATTVHLLSRRHPADLPVEHLTLQFQEYVNISMDLSLYLQKLLEPHVEDRFSSTNGARQALTHLASREFTPGPRATGPQRPRGGARKKPSKATDVVLSIFLGVLILPTVASVFIASHIMADIHFLAGLACFLPLAAMLVIIAVLYVRSGKGTKDGEAQK